MDLCGFCFKESNGKMLFLRLLGKFYYVWVLDDINELMLILLSMRALWLYRKMFFCKVMRVEVCKSEVT